ncbi:unnamed protein product [Lactuca virosa]|uniref:Uncharacterized protein n=1 Tax=Lactuca virosa TaxID=75947 RepID=A0AAU9LYN1_9ASTR|nr:unnamed protein product [Lactuca virosa]
MNSPRGEGCDSNNVTTMKTSTIVRTNTKRGWISLSIPTRLRPTRAQSMEKEETREHSHEVTELDRKHNQRTASAGVARVGNCSKKEDVDRRLTTIVIVRNWQRLPPGRHLVNNLTKNRASNEKVTQKEVKLPKGYNQETKAGE